MLEIETEKTLAKLLGLGGGFVSIFLLTGSVTDPVNAPKFFILGAIATGIMTVVLTNSKFLFQRANAPVIGAISIFLIVGLATVVSSTAPVVQSLYGNYGRNTGFLTYLFFAFIFIGGIFISSFNSIRIVESGFLLALSINIVYCTYVLIAGDFVGWNNPSGKILGTFGNQNFVSSFLGIGVGVFCAKALDDSVKSSFRVLSLILAVLSLVEALSTASIQGVVIAVSGVVIVIFLKLRSLNVPLAVRLSYVISAIVAGLVALLGTLQIGPLTSLLYKTSVSLRGEYWAAGINMGNTNFLGLGFDSYGDWYRSYRRPSAIVLPGPNVVTNAAHNVFIDIYSAGGILLLTSYVVLVGLSGYAALKIFRHNKKFNSTSVSIILIWIGYQLQSTISINQIGLAVWGWVSGGVLLGMARNFISNPPSNEKKTLMKSRIKSQKLISANLIACLGITLGAIISAPPLSADMKLRTAQLSGNAIELEKSMASSYLSPQNSLMRSATVSLFEQSKLADFAHRLALENVQFNPNSFDAWRLLYFITNSTVEERQLAAKNMRRLDPLNPDVLKLS